MWTIQPTHTLKKVSESSQSPLVSLADIKIYKQAMEIPNLDIELELDEEGTRISLTIVDTPGFGDQIDNEAR